jgi:hypothetical protein
LVIASKAKRLEALAAKVISKVRIRRRNKNSSKYRQFQSSTDRPKDKIIQQFAVSKTNTNQRRVCLNTIEISFE